MISVKEVGAETSSYLVAIVRDYLVEIHRAPDADALSCAELCELSHLPERIGDGSASGWLALDNKLPVGCVVVHPTGEMGRLYVRPAHRGKGIARSLIEAAAARATWTAIAIDNDLCRSVLSSIGWADSGLREPGYRTWIPAVDS